MEPLAALLREEVPRAIVLPYLYGYILGASIALPVRGRFVRRRAVRNFQKWVARQLQPLGPDVELDAVGHSFGTHLLHRSMVQEGGFRPFFRRVVYMGGIVSTREKFEQHDDHVEGVLNLFSREDEVVFSCPFGHCGWKGFKNFRMPVADKSLIGAHGGVFVKQFDMTPLGHQDYTQPGTMAWTRAAEWLKG